MTEDKNGSLRVLMCVHTFANTQTYMPRYTGMLLHMYVLYRHRFTDMRQISLYKYNLVGMRLLISSGLRRGRKILWKSLILQEPLRLNLNADT